MRLLKQKRDKAPRGRLGASIAAKIQRNPSLAGGATALWVVMGLVTLNAVWFQSGKHPSPIFSTRTSIDSAKPAGWGSSKNSHAKLSSHQNSSPNSKVAVAPDDLTREIQTALATKGMYEGSLDGLFGMKTKSAIIDYQNQSGISADGEVSAKLLSHILLSGKVASRIPVPKLQISLNNAGSNKDQDKIIHKMVSTIQSGLKNYGYEDIVIDGVMGNQTANAIRRFELDYGLRITGKASASILEKLTDIGVINQG